MSPGGGGPHRAARRGGLALALAALVAMTALAACRRAGEGEAAVPAEDGEGPAAATTLALHFPGEDGMLHVEQRRVELPPAGAGRLAAIVGAVLAGPTQAGLVAPFPEGVTVASAYLDPQGLAYVDLAAAELPDPPPSGSTVEMARVFSVVNSVLANEERARGVVLLWNGRQRQTFAGHVDTQHPLLANRQLVR